MSLNVVIVTQDDPFYMPHFYRSLFSNLDDEISVKSVICLDLLNDSTVELARRMYGLYGPINFVRRSVDFTFRKVATKFGKSYSVKRVCRDEGIPVSVLETVNDPHFVDSIRERDIDIILSVSAPEIFESELLNAPNWGCLNVHTASLPKYRGMLPTFWALYHGEDKIGVTVHTMVEEIDRGEAVKRASFSVSEDDTLDDVIIRGKKLGGKTAAAALQDIAQNRETLDTIEGEGSYFSFPSKSDRKEFQNRGGELL